MSGDQFLPFNNGEKEPQKPIFDKNDASSGHQERSKILIVEDERLIAEDLKEILQNAGHTVVGIFSSGEEVLKQVDYATPDLILMDIRLKGSLDGIQTAIAVHRMIKTIPILFLTAHAKNQYPHLSALPSSSFMYVTKPFKTETLLKSIKRLLSSKID